MYKFSKGNLCIVYLLFYIITTMTNNMIQGEILEVIHWTDKLYSLKINAPGVDFTPGQFAKLGMMIDDEFISRPYSFVNSPDENILEFYSIHVPDGPLSTKMKDLKKGEEIHISRQGSGFLVMNEMPKDIKTLWMLSTGTAIGPFLSILKTKSSWDQFHKAVLVHSVRYANELTYKDTIDKIKVEKKERFHYVPCVSRESNDFSINHRITDAIEENLFKKKFNLDILEPNSHFMLCGNPDMVTDVTDLLKKLGYIKHRRRTPGQISTENYW